MLDRVLKKSLLVLIIGLYSAFLPAKEIRDLYFEIHSDDIKSLLETKASLKKFEKFHCEVYWLKDRSKVVVKADNITKELKEIVEKACERKSSLARPFDLKDYLRPFEKKEKKNKWQVYVDDTGINKINEVWIKESKNELDIIEKRPIGTTKVNYKFTKKNSEKILKEVALTSYEGIQNVKTNTSLEYKSVGDFHLPSKLIMETEQNLSRKEIGDYTRKFTETFYFTNYKVNESKALMYFSQN